MTSICICGAGTMGAGIAQVAAAAGYRTIIYDVSTEVIEKSKKKLETDLYYLATKQKISWESKEFIWQHLSFTTRLAECKADVIIEAVVENMEIKTALLKDLESINGTDTIFASNTSSLSISVLAERMSRPAKVAGLHFFNPAPLMKLVEVVRGDLTSDHTVLQLIELCRKLGKTAVVCKDSPGFIVNRVARPFYIESLRLVEEGIAGYQVIDQLMESRGFKMGPFRLMDLIGNDINYAVSCSVYEQLNRPSRLKPSFIQNEKVQRGELGKKTGKGYYDY